MKEFVDLDWIAAQAGVPVSFLIGIPVFFVLILTLASMMGTKEPENYRIGRHAEVKRDGSWLAPIGLMILIGIAITNYGKFFTPS